MFSLQVLLRATIHTGIILNMSKPVRCTLKCLDGSSDDIELNNVHVKAILGRGPLTKINDKRCSRSQVLIELSPHSHCVKLKQLGSNHSGLNGEPLVLNEEKLLKNGDVVEVLHNMFKYHVEFDGISTLQNDIKHQQIEDELLSVKQESSTNLKEAARNPVKRSIDKVEGTTSISGSSSKKFKLSESSNAIDPDMKGTWDYVDNGKLLVFTSNGVSSKSKIAAFDLDGTLITTKSGKVFPVDTHDWKLLFPNVETVLKQYIEDDYKIVIFTNQGGIGKKKTSSRDFQKKAEAVIKAVNVPVQVFIATQNDKYRKPVLGMWDYLTEEKNNSIGINQSESFYVGDAAGRAANWAPKKKKDFACTDYLFALNLNLAFYTPEQIFLKEKAPEFSNLPTFKPKEVFQNSQNAVIPDIANDKKQVLIMVGSQGSGKSNFVSTYLKPLHFTIANRDTLGSWQKCVSVMEAALCKGSSVVVDNTNPDKESRQKFIQVAKNHAVRSEN
uniref:Bifunctional polynucleotide phosphatase/kinase n=3 Tax=Cacopsylla melanoneura TaxID=428564 RepID=A0A8D8VVP4_9HEMI